MPSLEIQRKVGNGGVKVVTIEAFTALISALSLQLIAVDAISKCLVTSECCLLGVADEEWYSLKRVSSQWQSNIEIELYAEYFSSAKQNYSIILYSASCALCGTGRHCLCCTLYGIVWL